MLIFTAALITLIITLIIIYMIYGQSKLKALLTNIAVQRIKAVGAGDLSDMLSTCKMQWYIMGMLTLSMPHATIVAIRHLVQKVPSMELLHATKLSMRLV